MRVGDTGVEFLPLGQGWSALRSRAPHRRYSTEFKTQSHSPYRPHRTGKGAQTRSWWDLLIRRLGGGARKLGAAEMRVSRSCLFTARTPERSTCVRGVDYHGRQCRPARRQRLSPLRTRGRLTDCGHAAVSDLGYGSLAMCVEQLCCIVSRATFAEHRSRDG